MLRRPFPHDPGVLRRCGEAGRGCREPPASRRARREGFYVSYALDKSVSALDKSVQAQVLNLLQDLKIERALTYVLISHDLNVIEYVSERILVMYLGQVVEAGTAETLPSDPKHPYTQALFASARSMDPSRRMEGPPILGDPPSGCRFRTRCAHAMPQCGERIPPPIAVARDHVVACYLYGDHAAAPAPAGATAA